MRCDNVADTTLPGVRSTSETTGPVDPQPTSVTVVPDQLPAVTVEPQAVLVQPTAVIVQPPAVTVEAMAVTDLPPAVTVEPLAVTDQPAAGVTTSKKSSVTNEEVITTKSYSMMHIIIMHLFVGGWSTASAPQDYFHVSQLMTTSL